MAASRAAPVHGSARSAAAAPKRALARPRGGGTERLLHLQRSVGNAAVAQLLARHAARCCEPGSGLQVGPPNDRFEREARAASAAVTAGRPVGGLSRLPSALSTPAPPAQPLCAECAAEEAQRVPATGPATLDTATARRAMKAAGSGAPLDPDMRQNLERSFGRDLRGVRVHAGLAGQRAADALQARAFASGRDIYLAPGESAKDRGLMAHEVAHVVQQTSPRVMAAGAVEAPRPVARLARGEAAGGAIAQREPSLTDRVAGAVGGTLSEAGDNLVAVVQDPASLALKLLPPPVALLIQGIRGAGGIVGYLGGLVRNGLGALLRGLGDISPTLAGVIATVQAVGARVGAVLGALAGGDCGPLFAAMNELQAAVSEIAGEAWDKLSALLAPVGAFFTDLWQRFGAPTIDWLAEVAGDVWADIKGIASRIWEGTAPVREAGAEIWGALKRIIGIGEEAEGGGLIGWVTDRANEAWTGIKALAQPALAAVETVARQIRDVLPIAAIMDLRGTIQRWLQEVSATATALGDPAATGSEGGQATLRETLLPALDGAIGAVRGGTQTAAAWVGSQIGALADGLAGAAKSIGSVPVLSFAASALGWVAETSQRLGGWARGGVGAVLATVEDGLAALSRFGRRALDFLIELGGTVGDLAGRLPGLVLGPLWRGIPACIRDPVVDFLVNQVLRRIPVFSQLMEVPDLWNRCADLALTLIRQIFVDGALARAAWTFFSAMLKLIGLPPELVVGIVAKAATAFGDILRDPVGFLGNLLQAVKTGLSGFLDNALTHLLNGVTGWLFHQASKAGLTPPASLSAGEIFRFVLDVLGLGIDFVFERIGEAVGPETAAKLRRGMEIAGEALVWLHDLVTEGPAALWRHVSAKLAGLWDSVLDAVVSWVSETIVTKAITRLLSSLDPTGIGAVVNSVITIYRAIESAVEYLRPMLEMVQSVLDGIGDIARGAIAGAAAFVEGAMARAVPILVGFLANQVGLGDVGQRIGKMIEKLRVKVTSVVDRLIKGALGLLKSVAQFGRAAGGAAARWLGLKTTFRTKSGETHTLSVEARGGRPEVMLASEVKPLSQHLREFREEAQELSDPDDRKEVRAALAVAEPLARRIEASARKAAEATPDSKEFAELQKQIRDLEFDLQAPLRELFEIFQLDVPEELAKTTELNFSRFYDKGLKGDENNDAMRSFYISEYARQLKDQESQINATAVYAWLENRAAFAALKKASGGKRERDPRADEARKEANAEARRVLTEYYMIGPHPVRSLTKAQEDVVDAVMRDEYLLARGNYANLGITAGLSRSKAAALANHMLTGTAALHGPDSVAGGIPIGISGIGSSRVNSDIGANWSGKFGKPVPLADRLHGQVERAYAKLRGPAAFRRRVRMKVKLN